MDLGANILMKAAGDKWYQCMYEATQEEAQQTFNILVTKGDIPRDRLKIVPLSLD